MKTLGPIVCVLFLAGIALGGRYCPRKPNEQCYVRNNKCCCDNQCEGGKICCDENCGNTCRTPARRPTPLGGTHVEYDPKCQLGIPKVLYCPMKSKNICVRSQNECCEDDDCNTDRGEFCCQENCGRKCHQPIDTESDGERVDFDPTCEIDPY